MTAPAWRAALRRHDLVGFFGVAVALTWAVWIPRAMGVPVGVFGPLSTWTPALAAVGWAALVHGRPALRDLGRRLLRWRVRWWWYPVVVLGPLGFALIAGGVTVLAGQSWNAVEPGAMTLPLPAMVVTLLALALTDGLGEEPAWRGYLLPRLLRRGGAVTASLVLGVGWWLWHLPLVWTPGAPIEGEPLWLLLADLLAKSVLFTVVFVHTGGSVLIAVLLHAATNLFSVSPPPGPDGDVTLSMVALVLKAVLAGVLAVHLRPRRS